MLAPISAIKHYVQFSLANVVGGAITKLAIVDATDLQDVTAASEVIEGSIVKAVYIELWVTSDDVTQSSGIITLEKKMAQSPAMTAAQSALLMKYPNKKNVLYTTMGLYAPKTGANPIPVIRQWFKIPKGKQRFGFDDQLNLNVHAQSDGVNLCGFATYKEYT